MDYERSIQSFFKGLGYSIKKITEMEEKSPDFFIYDDTSSYILELKTKFTSNVQDEMRERSLNAGEIYNIDELVIRKNILSGIIKKAKKQLEGYNPNVAILRLVWLLSTGYLAEPRMHQFAASLYGSSTFVDFLGTVPMGNCFFFRNSDFYRYRDVLDAAIVSTETERKLLMNPLSPRYEQMKNSSLPNHFRKDIVDPLELEKEGKAFIVNSDVDRGDENAVILYLKEKYKSDNIQIIPMHYISGTILFPDNNK